MDAEGALLISRLWPIGVAIIGFVVWLVRLEGLVKMNTKLRHELDESLEELKQEFKDHRREIWSRSDYLRDLINGHKP